jgi:4-amino-4-deoxy-L-arabinose transferase-like glycosyltransferase
MDLTGRRPIYALLLLALVIRIAAAATTAVISHDGARFTMSARAIRAGDWETALNVEPRMPPLYPTAIAGLSRLTGDLGLSGVLISIFFGTLAAIPLFLLAREAFPREAALLAALILAILPSWAGLGGDVWTEPLFLFLLFSSFAATWFAGERPAAWKYALAGILGGLAVLTRPEGIYAAAAIVGWGAIAAIVHRREGEGRTLRVAGPILALALFAVILFPYSKWIHDRFGFWSFTPNMFAARLVGSPEVEKDFTQDYYLESEDFEVGRDEAHFGRLPGKIYHVLKNYHRVNGYVFLPFLVVGLFVMKRARRPGTALAFLIILAVGYAIPTWWGFFVGVPFGERYVLPSFLVLAPVTAVGVLWAWERLTRAWTPERARPVGIAALVLLVLGCSIGVARPHGTKRRTLVDAGRWIRERYGPGRAILTMDRRVEHYADAWSERLPPTFERTRKLVAERAPVVVVMYEPYVSRHEPEFEEKLAAAYRRVHIVPKGPRGHEVRIYEVRPPP